MSEKTNNQKCIECQACCKYISFHFPKKGDLYLYQEFANIRNAEYVKVKNGNVYFRFPSLCRYLKEDGCSIYNMRPQICKNYDGRFDPAMEDLCKL